MCIGKISKKQDKKIKNTRKSALFAVDVPVDAKNTGTMIMEKVQQLASEVDEDDAGDYFVVLDDFDVNCDRNSADNVADMFVISGNNS